MTICENPCVELAKMLKRLSLCDSLVVLWTAGKVVCAEKFLSTAVSDGGLVLSLGSALLGESDLLLLLVDALGNDGLVVGDLVFLGLGLSLAERAQVAAVLEALGSDQSLDLGAEWR